MRRTVFLGLVMLAKVAFPATALDVVTTSPSMGALVREVAGTRAELTVLAGPTRDLHTRRACAERIWWWLSAPSLRLVSCRSFIDNAANPEILPSSNGYFEAAVQVPLLDTGTAADLALGDVHPLGNPHVTMDPVWPVSPGHWRTASL